MTKWNKQKESSASRVNICNVLLKVFKTSILVCYTAISNNIVGKKSQNSSNQDPKVMWVVSNPSFGAKIALSPSIIKIPYYLAVLA